jgi:hypothetical protein
VEGARLIGRIARLYKGSWPKAATASLFARFFERPASAPFADESALFMS